MNKKIDQWVVCVLFCAFLLGMLGLYLTLPKEDFSQQEKRYLAESPELDWESLATGRFSEEIETYMADHMPGRSFFVGMNAYVDLLTGRQVTKDVFLTEDSRLVEAPAQSTEAAIAKNMGILNTFAEKTGASLDLMIVPSAGWAAQESGAELPLIYEDETIIQSIYDQAGESIRTVDILSVFRQNPHPETLYYKTDHHWNSLGAYTAYRSYMQLLDREYPDPEDYRIETVSDFYGSTYSRSALWLTPGEELELWHGSSRIYVAVEESTPPQEGIFFRNRLQEADKYTVFLDGNHPIVRLENQDNPGKGKLLVIRDSFSNCLGGFLGDSYEAVVLVDLRYYRQPVSQLLEAEAFDQILVCYSIGNFLTDTNLTWLR